MANFGKHNEDLVKSIKLNLSPEQKVILLIGPSGSGKSTTGERVAQNEHWIHISEDKVWSELVRIPRSFRTPEEKAIVQPKSVQYIVDALQKGNNVLFEFIVYEVPPQPIVHYQSKLEELGIPFETRVLLPSVDALLNRQKIRGREFEKDIENQRSNAELQISCLSCDFIKPEWVIDSTHLSEEETYRTHFAKLVEES